MSEYGKDPYLDGLKVRLATKYLEQAEELDYIFKGQYHSFKPTDEIKDLQKQIKEYLKEK